MDEIAAALCRHCLGEFAVAPEGDCPRCGQPRLVRHPELMALTLAHIDCDAFYATIEKRDNPALADKPVIVGGGRRGVATTACYIARRYGVRSAMPMFKALELCPQAVVIPPDMAKYAAVSAQVQAIFLDVTPLVEAVSLDEAYLDLSGTEALHRRSPAATLAAIARRVEQELAITVSIGLSHNKLLAKLASEMDKPRGFGVIGRAEAEGFLAARPVRILPGVGRVFAERLGRDGLASIAAVQRLPPAEMTRRYGTHGAELARLARGIDPRAVEPEREAKSISAETTFERDLRDPATLRAELWPLCEKVSRRLKRAGLAGRTAVLKLKTGDFKLLTRRRQLEAPTQLADALFRVAAPLLEREARGGARRFRLIGVGATELEPAGGAGDAADLFEPGPGKREAIERAMDHVREKFGERSIRLGRGLRPR